MIFKDRIDAGKQLADQLLSYKNQKNVIVLGLPRGGIICAAEVAKKLNVTLDIIVPRKIGAPYNPELAIGAITEDGQAILDESLISMLNVSKSYIEQEKQKQQKEAIRRLNLYRKNRPPLNLSGKIIILIDDGIATGSTMKAAIKSAKVKKTEKIIIAVPVAPSTTIKEIKSLVDEVICLSQPALFGAIGQFYRDFSQTTDEEVISALENTPK